MAHPNWEHLAGPKGHGEYQPGDFITFDEQGRTLTGEVLWVAAPHNTVSGAHVPTSYHVDCDDGWPHIVYQSQIKA